MTINSLRTGLCTLVLGAAFMLQSGCATIREAKDGFMYFGDISAQGHSGLVKAMWKGMLNPGESFNEDKPVDKAVISGGSAVLLTTATYAVATQPEFVAAYLLAGPAVFGIGAGVGTGLPEDIRNLKNAVGNGTYKALDALSLDAPEVPLFPGFEGDPRSWYD